MRIYIVHNPTIISPMQAPACDAWLMDAPAGIFMQRIFKASGLEIAWADSWQAAEALAQNEQHGALVVSDAVVCSRTVFERFLRLVKKCGAGSYSCAIPRGRSSDYLARVEGLSPCIVSASGQAAWTAPLYFVKGKALLSKATPLLISYKEHHINYTLPPGLLERNKQVYALTDCYLCNIQHWIHILRTNMAALGVYWLERVRMYGYAGGIAWYLWRLLCGFPWTGGRLMEAVNKKHINAKMHHWAYAELSVIEKGARIESGAVITKSYIGAGAVIMKGAHVTGSVIAPGAYVARGSSVVSSVVYPKALAAQMLMQGCILGEESCALTNSNFFDMSFSKNIRVLYKGNLVDTGSPFLGVCVGPRARVSAGIWVAYGREIPAGTLLVRSPSEVVGSLDGIREGTTAVCRDGKAVPIDEPPDDQEE